MLEGLPVIVRDREFEADVLAGSGLVLVGFWADWSGACHLMTPVMEAIARESTTRMKVVLVDIDRAPGITGRYGVVSVPALLFFRRGRLVETIVGTFPKKALEERALTLAEGGEERL